MVFKPDGNKTQKSDPTVAPEWEFVLMEIYGGRINCREDEGQCSIHVMSRGLADIISSNGTDTPKRLMLLVVYS